MNANNALYLPRYTNKKQFANKIVIVIKFPLSPNGQKSAAYTIMFLLLQYNIDPFMIKCVLSTFIPSSGERYGSKKSLIILTSKATAGAAEEFVYIMRNLGRAMIMGETTNGSSHPPKNFRVGETDIFLSIPTVHSDTTFGPGWEGAGIAPHLPVPADDALEYAKTVLNKHFAGQK